MTTPTTAEHFPRLHDTLEEGGLTTAHRVLNLVLLSESLRKAGAGAVQVQFHATAGQYRIVEVRDPDGSVLQISESVEQFLTRHLSTVDPLTWTTELSEVLEVTANGPGFYTFSRADGPPAALLGRDAMHRIAELITTDYDCLDSI